MKIYLGFAVGLAGVSPQSCLELRLVNLVNTSQLSLLNLASAGGSFKGARYVPFVSQVELPCPVMGNVAGALG